MNKKIFFFVVGFIIVAAFVLIKPYFDFVTKTLKISPLKTLLSFDSLQKYDNQVNILILGIAGLHYEGPDLSDSIMVANYNLKTNKLTTISIPRDIWSDTLKDKINSAYAYGEDKQKGGGLKLAKAEIEAVVGFPIQYAMVIDFDSFTEFVDFLGGLDIDVERSFVDHQFPVPGKENDLCGGDPNYGCRYQTVSFEKGKHHMDGKTTLTYVRSRHAEGVEGSDFARNARELRALKAMKERIMKILISGDLQKIEKLYKNFDAVIIRDITNQQLSIITKHILFSRNFQQKDTRLGEEFFIVPDSSQYDGKYVLIPPDGDYTTIHQYISCNIKKDDTKSCEKLVPTPSP